MDLASFKTLIWDHYQKNRRSFPWRDEISPYRVVVSEVMLQQTQADRVVAKFDAFIAAFPNFTTLAAAPFHDVLLLWKGLGYNRRALALHKIAQAITQEHQGTLPQDPEILVTLPGIGKATACSIVAFAFNKPVVFIETNIRTVFIHAFFADRTDIHDKELMPLIISTLDQNAPRDWYYALMDYGVMLKKTVGNKSRQSSHYHRQSRFVGSDRQIRGQILEVVLRQKSVSKTQLPLLLNQEPARVFSMLTDLCAEGLLREDGTIIQVS